jgi:hypothetical protein
MNNGGDRPTGMKRPELYQKDRLDNPESHTILGQIFDR